MRILVTADLHYNIARSRDPTEELAKDICQKGGDVLVLVGDTAGADLFPLRQALRLFDRFNGRKLFVPGNHCLWSHHGESSLDRYQRILPAVVGEEGFTLLDHAPAVVEGVGLIGSIGWYDYSLADAALAVPEAFYQAKLSPGAAAYLGGHEKLLAAHDDCLTARHRALRTRWADGRRVNLPFSDKEFCRRLCDTLAAQLAAWVEQVERIIVFLHHLPFVQLVPANRPDRFAFAAAFLGSERFGEILLNCSKVTHVFCGHSHWHEKRTIGHITVINIGSTYTKKRLEVLEI